MQKRIIWTAVCLALCLAIGTIGGALAEEPEIKPIEGETFYGQARISNERAETEYLNGLFGLPVTPTEELPQARGTASGSRFENGTQAQKLYNALKTRVTAAAAGSISSTEFTIGPAEYGGNRYLPEDLGASDYEAVAQAIADETYPVIVTVIQAVLYDCPYETYWYDITSGCGIDFAFEFDDDYRLYADIVLTMHVAADYSATGNTGTTDLDTSKSRNAQAAADNAAKIVRDNAGLGNYAKLTAYKEAICDLVDYNYEAAEGSRTGTTNYGDPWQLVWVFDGDPETKVVCEGYSKAFQYLCDNSRWNGEVSVISVSGTMETSNGVSGQHMWNLVRMNEKNYLADLTNSEPDSPGWGGELFLAGYDHTDANGGYVYVIEDKQIGDILYYGSETTYTYNDKMANTYTADMLIPSETDADPNAPEPYPNEFETAFAVWGITETEVLPGEEFAVFVTYYNGYEAEEITLEMIQGSKKTQYTAEGSSVSGLFSAANSTEQITIRCRAKVNGQNTPAETMPAATLTVKPGKAAPVPSISIYGSRATTADGTIRFELQSEKPGNGDYSDVKYEVTPVGEGAGLFPSMGTFAGETIHTVNMDSVRETGLYVAEGISFRLQVRAYGPGYESETALSRRLYVTGERDPEFTISTDFMSGEYTARMACNAANRLYIYTPGGVCNSVEVYNGDSGWTEYSLENGNEIWIDGPGAEAWDVPVAARYTTATGEKLYSNVLFTDYVRKLATPTATVPARLAAGKPLEITLGGTEGADSYEIKISDENDDSTTNYIYRSGKITAAATGLDAGKYTIRITAYSWRGLLMSETAEYELTVTGTRPAAPSLTIAIPENAQYGETCWATLEAEGMEAATRNGSGINYSAQNGTALVPATVYDYSQAMTFRGLIGGLWSEETEEIQIPGAENPNYPDAGDPEFSLMPAKPVQGQDLRVNVTPVEGGDVYTVSLGRISSTGWRDAILYDVPFEIANGGVTIQGCHLMQAGQYDITVTAYHGRNEEYLGETTKRVTVAANTGMPDAPTAQLLTEDNTIYGTTRFRVVTGGGADKVYTYVHTQDYGDNFNPTETAISPAATECEISWTNRGSGDYNAWFCVSRNGVWSEAYGPIPFSVSSGESWETEPVISLNPAAPEAGQDITVSWTGTEEADWCEVTAYLSEEGTVAKETVGKGISSYTLSGGLIPHSGELEIGVTAYRAGYYPAMPDEGATVTLLDPKLKVTATLLSADATKGTVTLKLKNAVTNRIRIRIDGEDAGLYGIGNSHGDSIVLTIPAESMSSRIQAANYDTDSTKWGTWSNAVTGRDAKVYDWDTELPTDLKEIGPEAFAGSSVSCVKIPNGCERIRDGAFAGVKGLAVIYIPATVTEIGENAIPAGTIIVTPAGSPAETWAGNRYTVEHP